MGPMSLYSSETYLDLVRLLRGRLPYVALSSDFIVGFCGEVLGHKPTHTCKKPYRRLSMGPMSLYSSETYLDLVRLLRDRLPRVALSSDFIVGFCGEVLGHKPALACFNKLVSFFKLYFLRELFFADCGGPRSITFFIAGR